MYGPDADGPDPKSSAAERSNGASDAAAEHYEGKWHSAGCSEGGRTTPAAVWKKRSRSACRWIRNPKNSPVQAGILRCTGLMRTPPLSQNNRTTSWPPPAPILAADQPLSTDAGDTSAGPAPVVVPEDGAGVVTVVEQPRVAALEAEEAAGAKPSRRRRK